jgi:hypothetical protein
MRSCRRRSVTSASQQCPNHRSRPCAESSRFGSDLGTLLAPSRRPCEHSWGARVAGRICLPRQLERADPTSGRSALAAPRPGWSIGPALASAIGAGVTPGLSRQLTARDGRCRGRTGRPVSVDEGSTRAGAWHRDGRESAPATVLFVGSPTRRCPGLLRPKGGKNGRTRCENGQHRPGPLGPLWLKVRLWVWFDIRHPRPPLHGFRRDRYERRGTMDVRARGDASLSGELRMPLNS